MNAEKTVNTILLAFSLTAVFPAVAQAAAALESITINTPIMKLLENTTARAIVQLHLPKLVEALDENFDVVDYHGSSSLKELSIDDNHIKNFDEELLAKIESDLIAAQN